MTPEETQHLTRREIRESHQDTEAADTTHVTERAESLRPAAQTVAWPSVPETLPWMGSDDAWMPQEDAESKQKQHSMPTWDEEVPDIPAAPVKTIEYDEDAWESDAPVLPPHSAPAVTLDDDIVELDDPLPAPPESLKPATTFFQKLFGRKAKVPADDNAPDEATPAKPKKPAKVKPGQPDADENFDKPSRSTRKKPDLVAPKLTPKQEAAAEKKRLALLAKEAKALKAKQLKEAAEEDAVVAAEAKARAVRNKKARQDWMKKQRRRVQIKANGGKVGFWQGTSKPKPLEIANAIRSLSIILDTSSGEIDPVKMMAEEFAGNQIGDAFDRIYERLTKENMTLVQAFEPEEIFPPVVHNMLKVGAKTAKPGPALRSAVALMDSGNDNKRKMRNAVREPLIVALISMGILFATAYYVVPTFLDMYEALNMPVGAITQFVITFSDISVWVMAAMAVVGVVLTIWWFAFGRSSLRVRVAIDRWKLHAPLIGKSEQTGEAYQMFNILNSYLTVGSTEREALLDTAVAMQNRAIKRHLRATANGLVRGEKTFAEFLDDEMFPSLARSILATGQRSGRTTESIGNLRDIYENESKVEGEQAVEKVVGAVSAVSSLLFVVTASIVSVPPLEIFGATLGYSG